MTSGKDLYLKYLSTNETGVDIYNVFTIDSAIITKENHVADLSVNTLNQTATFSTKPVILTDGNLKLEKES